MHPIKQDILEKLILSQGLRFAALRPVEVENNHFIYYLRQLQDEGMVEKTDNLYHLSAQGKQEAERMSLAGLSVRLQPKIVTAPVCFRDDRQEVLLFQWAREPGYGRYSLVNGKLHFGESALSAVERELLEKTGLKTKLKWAGNVYIREFGRGECKKHQLSHVFVGDDPTGEIIKCTAGVAVWVPINTLITLDLLPGTREIIDLLDIGRLFYEELELS